MNSANRTYTFDAEEYARLVRDGLTLNPAGRLVRDANYAPDEIDRVRRGGFQPEPRAEELAGDGPDS